MAYIFRTRTDGLGHATLRGCQDRWEQPPEPDDDTPNVDALTNDIIEVIGRACRADNPTACADLLREAAGMLQGLADEVAQ